MKRLAPLLALSCVAVGPCGSSGTGDDGFRSDGTNSPTETDDTGDSTVDEGTDGGHGFVSWTLDCDGDNQEYIWTATAETSLGVSVVYVELDPDTADWDTFYLDMQDGEGRLWESQTTELLTDRGCTSTAVLRWYALANSGGDATDEGSYP